MTEYTNGKFLFLDPTDAPPVLSEPELSCEGAELNTEEALAAITRCLSDAGYDPVTQLTAYLISDDPTYLPEETAARAVARRIGRDKLLDALLTFYLEHRDHE